MFSLWIEASDSSGTAKFEIPISISYILIQKEKSQTPVNVNVDLSNQSEFSKDSSLYK